MHPIALQLLERLNLPTEGLRSKSWDEFAVPGAAPLDFVFTVCDNAAGEACPYWPGQPMTAHWGVPDPAAVEGTEAEKWLAFRSAFQALDNRIKIFTSLPLTSLDRIKLQERLDAIGKTPPPGSGMNLASVCPPKESVRRYWLPPLSAPESWQSGWPEVMSPSRFWRTREPPSPCSRP